MIHWTYSAYYVTDFDIPGLTDITGFELQLLSFEKKKERLEKVIIRVFLVFVEDCMNILCMCV